MLVGSDFLDHRRRSRSNSPRPNMERPNIIHRSRSHLHEYRHGFGQLFQARTNSPSQPDIISSAKLIEEETQPKYNPNNFYPAKLGEILHDRYKIIAKLGYGMTATVWLAKDLKLPPGSTRKYVTIKINVNTLTDEFLKGREKIAEKLFNANPNHPGYTHVRFMIETFKVKNRGTEHLCIIYDVLREPIDQCMAKWPSKLFTAAKLRVLLEALLEGLDYLHSECRVVHTDLKADNIMMGLGDESVLEKFVQHELEHPSPRKPPDHHGRIIYKSCSDFGAAPTEEIILSAKITDLGLAEWGDERNNKPIQSNAFTAPEVILAAGWSYPADIWNLGVMLWDLIETFGLFDSIDTRPGKYNPAHHLGLMIALLGPPPKELLERGSTAATYFDENGEFRKPELILADQSFEASIGRMKGEEKRLFIDFAKKMICWLPEERWTAKQLIEHPFLTKTSFGTTESETELRDSLSLVERFAVSKRKSQTPLPGTPVPTPPAGTPALTPRVTPEPSIKGFSIQNRAHTMPHSPVEPALGATSAPFMQTRSRSSNPTSQDLINSILKKAEAVPKKVR